MDDAFKEAFFSTMLRIRKVGTVMPPECSIQLGELSVLRRVYLYCKESGRCPSVSEICETLQVTKPAVSQLLNSLEKREFIVRQIDHVDRRKISVSVTDEGEKQLLHNVERYDAAFEEVSERYGSEKLQVLIDEMTRFSDILDELRSEWGAV